MLILMEPPEQDSPEGTRKRRLRREYIALAAVILAIVASLAGVALVILEASAEPPRIGHLAAA
ncbi:MAG TPA: hypothetical protein VMG61_12745 [Usitatibacter sp.]|nr:hypothetical protein [Usitatibacter sp.]